MPALFLSLGLLQRGVISIWSSAPNSVIRMLQWALSRMRARARVCVWTHGQMDGWKDGVSVCVWEGGREGLAIWSSAAKKQRCSLQMSAAFSAQMKKKVLRSVRGSSSCTFRRILKRSSCRIHPETVLRCALCPLRALLRWPRNVLCVRLAVCQSTCVLRWRKAMRDDDTVLCHPLFKLLSIPAVVAYETSPCRWITEQRCTPDKLQLLVMMFRHLSGPEAAERTALNELHCFH